jgi:phosphate transport system protein
MATDPTPGPATKQHELRTEFHEHLSEIHEGIALLSAGVTELIPRVTDVLLNADLEGAEYVVLGDAEFDRRSRQIEEACFAQIALQQPVAIDLRQLVSAIKIVLDVERSADLCANIAKAARRIYQHDLDPRLRGLIQKMGAQAQLLFKECTEAYLHEDESRAAALHDIDALLDDLHRQFIHSIFESHSAGNTDLQVAVQLGLVARFYERIGDHAVNVGEHTRYIVSGWFPTHPYPESGNEVPDLPAPRSDPPEG